MSPILAICRHLFAFLDEIFSLNKMMDLDNMDLDPSSF